MRRMTFGRISVSKFQYVICGLLILVLAFRLMSLVSRAASNAGWVIGHREILGAKMGPIDHHPTNISGSHNVSSHILDLALRLAPWNSSAHAGMSQIMMAKGDFSAAQRWIQSSVSTGRNDAVTYLLLGNLAHDSGNSEKALEAWRLSEAEVYFYVRARQKMESGDSHEAALIYLRAIEINPEFDMAYLELGKYYFETGDFLAARDAFETQVSLKPNREGFSWLGRTLQKMGQIDAAKQAYQRAAELGELWHGYLAVGDLYLREGNFTAAREWYLRGQITFPEVWFIYIKLGNVSLKIHDYEAAFQYFNAALKEAPENPWPVYWMGKWFYYTGDYESARAWIEDALGIGLEPDFYTYLIWGNSDIFLGDCRSALRNYQLALRLQSENIPQSEVSSLRDRIEELESICTSDKKQ